MKLNLSPYSIYIGHRPFRVAFLVNPNEDQTWLDRIFEFNREKWGGRFNPIIFTDGKTIQDNWWKFLRDYDPDIIKTTVDLSEELQRNIHIFLSPLRVETVGVGGQGIGLRDDPLSILPTKKNIAQISRGLFDDESSIVIFEVEDSTPVIIRQFLSRNFGLYNKREMMTYHVKKSIDTCKAKTYNILDYDTLNQALLDLGEFRNRIVFPSQICSLPNSLKDVEYDHNNEKFAVIIGDTSEELTYLWNRSIYIANWMRTGFTQLWLPKEMADNQAIRSGLAKFINRFVDQTGNNYNGVHFITFSLPEKDIQTIATSFQGTIWHPRSSVKIDRHSSPSFRESVPFFYLRRGLELHRAHSDEEHLVLDEPDIEEGVMGGQCWFVDLYIQFRPERFTSIMGKNYWWQLPRRNNILYDLGFFNHPARVNEHGAFSVLMRRRSRMGITSEEAPLVVKLPQDKSIFSALICGERFDFYQRGDRERFLSRPFYTMQRSDKGMYLSGVLSLFPDLRNAHYLFEERFWRKTFERMSNQSDTKDAKKKTVIINKLKKSIDQGRDFKSSDEDIDWLAEKVLVFSKDYAKQEVDLSFRELADAARHETDEYNQHPSGSRIEFDENEFKESVSELVELGVLLIGVRPRCPRCGYRIWYHLDEVKQGILCKGCGYKFSLQAEEHWYYRLNSLVRAAVSLHGTIPLLLALGQLMFDAQSSFMFVPNMDLLNQSENETDKFKLFGEIDLMCIKDGKFIIGEIKQSVNLFKVNDFVKISDIAKLVRPDIVLFSSLDGQPNKLVRENIDKLRSDLSTLEIDVQWYPIHDWALVAQPVR